MLAIDVGNTTTSFGLFHSSGKLVSHFSIATQSSKTTDEIALDLKALASSYKLPLRRVSPIILCSVVPRMSSLLLQAMTALNTSPVRVVGQDLHVPLKNRYAYPEQVGQDRLVGAYAAWRAYRSDCIIADFGTAITIDVVTKSGDYLGGVIAPGLEISLEALATRTALLPKIELGEPPELLGRDTANSIRSGLLYGCAALCDGLVAQLRNRYVPAAKVIATGGASPLITRHTTTIDDVRPYLVLEGLHQLSLRQKPR